MIYDGVVIKRRDYYPDLKNAIFKTHIGVYGIRVNIENNYIITEDGKINIEIDYEAIGVKLIKEDMYQFFPKLQQCYYVLCLDNDHYICIDEYNLVSESLQKMNSISISEFVIKRIIE